METRRAVLIFFLILFFLLSPDTSQPPEKQRKLVDNQLLRQHRALERLLNSSYGEFPYPFLRDHNVTSPKDQDGFAWTLLPEVQKRARAHYLELFPDTEKVSNDDYVTGSENAYEVAAETALPFYQNVSGTVRGAFVRQPSTEMVHVPVNLTSLIPKNKYVFNQFWRNVSESAGSLTLRIFEEDKFAGVDVRAREISANVAIHTESAPGSGWEMEMFGVHYPKTGLVILTTTSEKFPGILTLPHLALTRSDFDRSKALLNHSLSATISPKEKTNMDGLTLPWTRTSNDESASIFSAPRCECIVFLQQQPVRFTKMEMPEVQLIQLLKVVEKELRFPEGAPIPMVPPMVFSAIVFSPDCGFILETGADTDTAKSQYLSGPKIEAFWKLMRHLLLALVIVLGLQISLLKRQMDEASTPSMRSRTSYYSVAIMAMGDGLMLASLIAFSMINDTGFLMLTSAGFLCFLNFAIFEMKFVYDIWLVQVGHPGREQSGRQGQRQNEEIQSGNTIQPQENGRGLQPTSLATSTPSGLPLPVTASRPLDTGATPIILPPDQDIEAAVDEDWQQTAAATGSSRGGRTSPDFQTLYSRFYFSMLVLVFFSLWAFSWPKRLRSAYVNVLCFVYLSFWTPQIHRNVMRNCRRAFTWEYVIGISILRLLPIMYCYTNSSNALSIETDSLTGKVLAGWVALQVLALAVQQFLGPRLFVKESWCPPAYDYHPLLQSEVGDVESGSLLPIGSIASASEAKEKDNAEDRKPSKNLKIFDCAICMNEIEVPVLPSKEAADRSDLGASWLGRRTYMVTPCRHIFHSECLEAWMMLRLICPICRESLPPL